MERSSGIGKIMLIASIVIDLVEIIVFIGCKALRPSVIGPLIDSTFMQNLKNAYICDKLGSMAIVAVLFSVAATGLLIFDNVMELDSFKGVMISGLLLVMSVVFFGMGVSHALPAMTNEPNVVTLTVADTTTVYHGGKSRSRSYHLIMNNGLDVGVTYEQYSAAKKGDTFYVVCCGSEGIGVFSPSEYRVPG